MEWITSLLKHLQVARSAILALLIASAAMLLGHKLAPDYIDPLPKEWSFLIVGALVFSATLIFIWCVSYAFKTLKTPIKSVTEFFSARLLGELEQLLLLEMAVHPTKHLDLECFDYHTMKTTRIELLQAAHLLEQKGFARINPYYPSIVSLSTSGRILALKLQRNSHNPAR